MKIQFEQLQEFRTKIMAAQASLQKELQRAKQEAKDAIEAKEQHAQEMADLSDNVEMITLDKEMAEEKADTLQLELESSKERIEELQVDLELLRSEMQNKAESAIGGISGDGDSPGLSTYEFKQLEQQNIRLKETLVRLRDLSAHDKHDIQKLSKELDMKRSEVAELERTKEKLSAKIDDLEATVADLQVSILVLIYDISPSHCPPPIGFSTIHTAMKIHSFSAPFAFCFPCSASLRKCSLLKKGTYRLKALLNCISIHSSSRFVCS